LQDVEALYTCIRKGALPDPSRVERAADLLELLYWRYVELNAPTQQVMERIRAYCAFQFFKFAHLHRTLDAALAARLLQRAHSFDAALFDQPKVKELLAEQPLMESQERVAMP
jgi:hypothetical protein